MRTTVTLDDDLFDALKRQAQERDVALKEVLNDAIRAGLAAGTPVAKKYRMRPRNLGVRPGVNLVKALELSAELEDSEIVRKLEQGR